MTQHHLLGGLPDHGSSKKLIAFAATGALVLAACGSDDDWDSTETTAAGEETDTTEAMDDETATTEAMDDETATTEAMDDETATTEAMDDETDAGGAVFAVDVSNCDDPDAATAIIEGSIGSVRRSRSRGSGRAVRAVR